MVGAMTADTHTEDPKLKARRSFLRGSLAMGGAAAAAAAATAATGGAALANGDPHILELKDWNSF